MRDYLNRRRGKDSVKSKMNSQLQSVTHVNSDYTGSVVVCSQVKVGVRNSLLDFLADRFVKRLDNKLLGTRCGDTSDLIESSRGSEIVHKDAVKHAG